jgi:hypothetical protein
MEPENSSPYSQQSDTGLYTVQTFTTYLHKACVGNILPHTPRYTRKPISSFTYICIYIHTHILRGVSLSCPRARQLYRIDSLHPSEYLVTAAMIRIIKKYSLCISTTKGTACVSRP